MPAVPLAICVKSTGWDLMARYYPAVANVPTHWRGDGKCVRYIVPPSGAAPQPAADVRHIIFPRHRQDATTSLTPVARSAALGRLMGECLALKHQLDAGIVEQLVGWIEGIECYSLEFSSLEKAVGLIQEIV